PNIAAIHSFEHADDVHFLVLELVPGETLAERVAKGPLPVDEALEVCRQIAEGVEAAHEKGVIHRDLKPANVKVTPEGKVKILDFGLAKAFEAESPVTDISQSPTLTEAMTRAGVILGTAAYMSPEQARGKPVDKRADIFAFGSVLFELLTGKRAFEGETVTDTIASILKGEPEWDLLPQSIPSTIRFLLSRCLKKDPNKRLQHIDGARILIEEALSGAPTASAIGRDSAIQPSLWKRSIPWSITTATVILAASIGFWSSPQPESASLTKFVIIPTPTAPLANGGNNDIAISRDGRHIVFAGQPDGKYKLYLRSLDNQFALPISGTEGGLSPFLSPDGEWVAFSVAGKLRKVPLRGGSPITLCDAPGLGASGSWGPGNTIVFSSPGTVSQTLFRVSTAGGKREMLATPDADKGELEYQTPEILPDGKAVLFSVELEDYSVQIAVLSLETGEQKTVLEEGGRQPHYAPTGHLVYVQAGTGTLMGVPFDLERREVMGQPAPILEGIRGRGNRGRGNTDYAFSSEGTLVYVPDFVGQAQRSLVWVDRKGESEPLTDLQRQFGTPKFSPDGARLAVQIVSGAAGQNIWIYEMASEILTPFTFQAGQARSPIWTLDGKRLTFSVDRDPPGIFWRSADGSGEREQLTQMQEIQIPNSWSRDGALAYSEGLPAYGNIWTLSLEGERQPQEFLVTEFNERHPMFSPDGRWIAFTSDRSGQDEIYVKPYPGPGGIVQISSEGGSQSLWARDGKELFYRNGDNMMVVSVQTEPTFKMLVAPRVLFEGTYLYGSFDWAANYDISPNGQRFLMIKQAEAQTQINVIQNWFEELKRLVPTN
ncbi:MAG: protein kinase, partial [Acidobacteria bacterium]|nr:protein kinase [Acidobacteriota bacterium]